MSEQLAHINRYHNPAIRFHLASQYVLGTLTPRVERRMSKLMKIDDELVKEIYQWQSKLQGINDEMPEAKPPTKVWYKLSRELAFNQAPAIRSWWRSLFLWQGATVFSILGSLSLIVILTQPNEVLNTLQGPSYLAVLSADIDSDSEQNKTLPELIVSAYKSPTPGQSELHFQWNKNAKSTHTFPPNKLKELTLWAIDKTTGKQVSLGSLAPNLNKQQLTKVQWKLIKNSKELWLTQGKKVTDTVIFKGECLQLSSWKAS